VLGGDLTSAGALLDRPYSIKGIVAGGAKLGHSIGFPTANLKVLSELTPGNGVYAARATIGRRTLNALVNIGTAPTFARGARCVEVHLIGFKGDIYGRPMQVAFLKRLRDEMRFPTKEALARQIRKDRERAEKLFASKNLPL
jgi:riboflavin kinase/FMN adenylyltransferase